MTKDDFARGWAMLLTAFPEANNNLTDEQRKDRRKLYATMVKDMDAAHWQAAVERAIATNRWFPKVSELLEHGRAVSGLPDGNALAGDAFSCALRAVKRLDPLTSRPMQEVREDVDATVVRLGGWARLALVEDDQINWYRKEFISAWTTYYGERAADTTRYALLGREGCYTHHEAIGSGPNGPSEETERRAHMGSQHPEVDAATDIFNAVASGVREGEGGVHRVPQLHSGVGVDS